MDLSGFPDLFLYKGYKYKTDWPSREEVEEQFQGLGVKITGASNEVFDLTVDLKRIPQNFPPHTFCNIPINSHDHYTTVHLSSRPKHFLASIVPYLYSLAGICMNFRKKNVGDLLSGCKPARPTSATSGRLYFVGFMKLKPNTQSLASNIL